MAGHVVRVEVQSDQLVIELANAKGADPKRKRSRNVIEVPWHKTPSTRRREALVPEAGPPQDARPIRSENRAILVEDQDEYAQSFIIWNRLFAFVPRAWGGADWMRARALQGWRQH